MNEKIEINKEDLADLEIHMARELITKSCASSIKKVKIKNLLLSKKLIESALAKYGVEL